MFHGPGVWALALGVLVACGAQPHSDASQRPGEGLDAGSDGAAPAGDQGALRAPDGQWTWFPFDGSPCRDGSDAGLSVDLRRGSRRVLLYLEGGGACYDAETCAGNPDRVFATAPLPFGVFDRNNPANPVGDWNHVYVPYCSGDLHMGSARDAIIPGVSGPQQFMGRPNLKRFLERLVPTFPDAELVLLAGVSAGGLGAIVNFGLVQQAFGAVPVLLVDDSGPVASVDHIPACLNQLRRRYWNLDATVIAECAGACDPDGDFLLQHVEELLRASPHPSGLVHATQDQVIRDFYGIATNNGRNDCGGTLSMTPVSEAGLEAALLDIRARLSQASPSFSSFFPDSTAHGWITGPALYTQAADNVVMVDWLRDVIAGKAARQLGP